MAEYCEPYTYDLDDDGIIFTGSGSQLSVEALSYQVEMDVNKRPPEGTLGGRIVEIVEGTQARNISGIFSGEVENDKSIGFQSDGHVNRNIRLITQFLQSVNPTIELLGFSRAN